MTARALILPVYGDGYDIRRWSLAAAVVVAAHFGLAAGYVLFDASELEGAVSSPTVIVDLAPIPVAPPSQLDLAPGPEMVEAQPTPKPPPQTKPEVVEPIPKIETPSEVTLPFPEPKAAEEKPKEAPDTQKSDTQRVDRNAPAPRTTAAPRSERQTAAKPAAPSPGSAASRAAIASWRDLVVARLQQAKRYPSSAEQRHEQGVATLAFSVDRNGRVLSRSLARSSGSSSLDQEVLAMIQRAQPLPAFPPAMTQAAIHLTVPIRFSLK
jgi:protein TonB